MKKYLFGFIGIVAAVAAFADVPPGTVGGDDVNPRTRLVTNAWENAQADIIAAIKVKSVNGKTGDVTLDADDVGALPNTYTAPVQSVNGMTGDVVIDIPTVPQKWALASLTNKDGSAVYSPRTGFNFGSPDEITRYVPYVRFSSAGGMTIEDYDGNTFVVGNSGVTWQRSTGSTSANWADFLTQNDVLSGIDTSSPKPVNSTAVIHQLSQNYYTKGDTDDAFLKKSDAQNTYETKQHAQSTFATKADYETKADAQAKLQTAENYADAAVAAFTPTNIFDGAKSQKLDVAGRHYLQNSKNWKISIIRQPSAGEYLMERAADGSWYCDEEIGLFPAMKLTYVPNEGYEVYAWVNYWDLIDRISGDETSSQLNGTIFAFRAVASGGWVQDKAVVWNTYTINGQPLTGDGMTIDVTEKDPVFNLWKTNNAVVVGERASAGASAIAIGMGAKVNANHSIAIGSENKATANGALVIGGGGGASVSGYGSAQIGTGANTTPLTLQFRGTTVVDGNGQIPVAELDTPVRSVFDDNVYAVANGLETWNWSEQAFSGVVPQYGVERANTWSVNLPTGYTFDGGATAVVEAPEETVYLAFTAQHGGDDVLITAKLSQPAPVPTGDKFVKQSKVNEIVSANLNTYVDGETGIEYVGKYYGGNLYYVPTGNVYSPNN